MDAQRALSDYDQMADVYAESADSEPMNVSYERPTMLAMAGDLDGKRVLDVGCAAGALSEMFVARGASVVGIDVNERLIQRARERLKGRAEFVVADISGPMPFLATASFDVVSASLVLHYLADWGPPLREFHRVLRPEGALLGVRWQKLWKLLTARRALAAGPMAASIRSLSSLAALTL